MALCNTLQQCCIRPFFSSYFDLGNPLKLLLFSLRERSRTQKIIFISIWGFLIIPHHFISKTLNFQCFSLYFQLQISNFPPTFAEKRKGKKEKEKETLAKFSSCSPSQRRLPLLWKGERKMEKARKEKGRAAQKRAKKRRWERMRGFAFLRMFWFTPWHPLFLGNSDIL